MKINYSKIWQEIGDAFETPYEERTERQKDMTSEGLCHALPLKMELGFNRIRWSVDVYGFWLMPRRGSKRFWCKNDEYRATFAYFMAAMGNREYSKLIKAVT